MRNSKFSLQHQPDLTQPIFYQKSSQISFQGSEQFIPEINAQTLDLNSQFIELSKSHQGSVYIQNVLHDDPIQTDQILLPKILQNLQFLSFSEYGNHIVQQAVQAFPIVQQAYLQLTSENQNLLTFSIHQHSSWPLRILLRNSTFPDEITRQLVQNIIQIANSTTGNYVIQHVLSNPLCPDQIIDSLISNAKELVFGKHASHLLEKLIYDDLLNINQLISLLKKLLFSGIEAAIFENRYSCFVIEKGLIKAIQLSSKLNDEMGVIISVVKSQIERSLLKYRSLAEHCQKTLLQSIQIEQMGKDSIQSFLTTLTTFKRKLSQQIQGYDNYGVIQ